MKVPFSLHIYQYVLFVCFYNSHSHRYAWHLEVLRVCIFWWSWCWASFICFLDICMPSLENVYSDQLLNFYSSCLALGGFFDVGLYEFSVYIEHNPLWNISACKYLLSRKKSFHFVGEFLSCAKTFQLDAVSFVYFYFSFPCLRKHILNKYYYEQCQRVYWPYFSQKFYEFRYYM